MPQDEASNPIIGVGSDGTTVHLTIWTNQVKLEKDLGAADAVYLASSILREAAIILKRDELELP